MKALDLTNKTFGRLLVLRRDGSDSKNQSLWKCRCSCGNEIVAQGYLLNHGDTKSCGCLKRDKAIEQKTTHGMRHTGEYKTWCGLIQRCTNPNSSGFAAYGSAGITVCDEWLESFENFFNDMGRKPTGNHSLDRINGALGYSRENCRWATREQQARNKKNNHKLTAFGETKVIAEWPEDDRCVVSKYTLLARIRRGISPELAITSPLRLGGVRWP